MTESKHEAGSSWYANHLNDALRLIGLVLLLIIAAILYHYLVHDILKTKHHYFTYFIIIWLLLAYIILPRMYRWLSRLFLPNYFIGRTELGDGMLGDPVNVAVIGSESELIDGMVSAGWKQADKINFRSSLKIVYAVVARAPYPTAPVSPLFLFGRKQDFVFEREIGDSPSKRHHARFWK